jgi:hypothetical protein
MKLRTGFVSNSSSSSFICEICGCIESGMDCGPEAFGMINLPCGHTMCKGHINDISEKEEELKKSALETIQKEISENPSRKEELEELYDDLLDVETFEEFVEIYQEEFDVEYTNVQCPICTFEIIRDQDMLNYFVKNNSLTKEEIACKVRKSLINGELKLL